jgi:hypothetical protein
MTQDQKRKLHDMLDKALLKADHFKTQGGKINFNFPKRVDLREIDRQVKVTVIQEDIERI